MYDGAFFYKVIYGKSNKNNYLYLLVHDVNLHDALDGGTKGDNY